jgi:hypothetical protein
MQRTSARVDAACDGEPILGKFADRLCRKNGVDDLSECSLSDADARIPSQDLFVAIERAYEM